MGWGAVRINSPLIHYCVGPVMPNGEGISCLARWQGREPELMLCFIGEAPKRWHCGGQHCGFSLLDSGDGGGGGPVSLVRWWVAGVGGLLSPEVGYRRWFEGKSGC